MFTSLHKLSKIYATFTNVRDPLLVWVRPSVHALSFIQQQVRGLGLGAIASIGCGCGTLAGSAVVLQKVPSELHPKVRNHGEGPY